MPKLTSLEDLFVQQLQDTYLAEGQILKAVQEMTQFASYPELKIIFASQAGEGVGHLRRLERVFTLVGLPPRGTVCDGIIGLLRESEKAMHIDAEPEVVDAALISAAQKLAHFEIASYGCLCTYAEMLGYDQAHDLLGQTLGRRGDHRRATHRALGDRSQSPRSRRRQSMTKQTTKGPTLDPKDVGRSLNDLLETLRDGEQGFKTAADAVEDAEIKRLFLSLGSQRAEFAAELEAELLRLGQEPAEHGHAAGAIHRGWINIRSAIAGKDEGPIVSEAERGEDFAVKSLPRSAAKGLARGGPDGGRASVHPDSGRARSRPYARARVRPFVDSFRVRPPADRSGLWSAGGQVPCVPG